MNSGWQDEGRKTEMPVTIATITVLRKWVSIYAGKQADTGMIVLAHRVQGHRVREMLRRQILENILSIKGSENKNYNLVPSIKDSCKNERRGT